MRKRFEGGWHEETVFFDRMDMDIARWAGAPT